MQIGGGVLVTVGLLGGAVVGLMLGEPSIGLVAGLVLGLAGAFLVGWLGNRRKG